jgi:hypothetical protein
MNVVFPVLPIISAAIVEVNEEPILLTTQWEHHSSRLAVAFNQSASINSKSKFSHQPFISSSVCNTLNKPVFCVVVLRKVKCFTLISRDFEFLKQNKILPLSS